jgi:hypothetical protein
VITGKVTSDYRVNGVPLIDGKAEIKVYITVRSPMGVGDKCVFASQEKYVKFHEATVEYESGYFIGNNLNLDIMYKRHIEHNKKIFLVHRKRDKQFIIF